MSTPVVQPHPHHTSDSVKAGFPPGRFFPRPGCFRPILQRPISLRPVFPRFIPFQVSLNTFLSYI